MPGGHVIVNLFAQLGSELPVAVSTGSGTVVEAEFSPNTKSIIRTFRSLAPTHTTILVKNTVNLFNDLQKLLATHGPSTSITVSLTIVLQLLGDMLFARWYPLDQESVLPLPARPPEPLDIQAVQVLFEQSRKLLPLVESASSAVDPYRSATRYFKTVSAVTTTGVFQSRDVQEDLALAFHRITFALSFSNWDLIYFKHTQPSQLLQSESNSAEAVNINVRLASWLVCNIAQLRTFLGDLCAAIPAVPKDRRLVLFTLAHRIIWNWVDVHFETIAALFGPTAAQQPGHVDFISLRAEMAAVLDALHNSLEIKKKPDVWGLAVLVLFFSPDPLGTNSPSPSIASRDSATMDPRRRTYLVDVFRKAIKTQRNTDAVHLVVMNMLRLQLMFDSRQEWVQGIVDEILAATFWDIRSLTSDAEKMAGLGIDLKIHLVACMVHIYGDRFLDVPLDGVSSDAVVWTCHALVYLLSSTADREEGGRVWAAAAGLVGTLLREESLPRSDTDLKEKAKAKLKRSSNEIPIIDVLAVLRACPSILVNKTCCQQLHPQFVKGSPLVRKEISALLVQATLFDHNDLQTEIPKIIQGLLQASVQSKDASLQVATLQLITDVFQRQEGLANSKLDWATVHRDLESALLTLLLTQDSAVINCSLKCIEQVMRWNMLTGLYYFSDRHNYAPYATMIRGYSFEVFRSVLTKMRPTPQIQQALTMVLAQLQAAKDLDRTPYLCFLIAAPHLPGSDLLARGLEMRGRINSILPFALGYIHRNNLGQVFGCMADVFAECDSQSLTKLLATLGQSKAELSENLEPVAVNAAPHVKTQAHAQSYFAFLLTNKDRIWWTTDLLDGVMPLIARYIGQKEMQSLSYELLTSLCRFPQLFTPRNRAGQMALNDLVAWILERDDVAVRALAFMPFRNYLLHASRKRIPAPALLARTANELPPALSLNALFTDKVVAALNDTASSADIDDVASVLFAFAAEQARVLDLVKWVLGREVGGTESENTLLRNNTLASKMTVFALKQLGEDYWARAIESVTKLPDMDLEVDPTKVPDSETRKKRLQVLGDTCRTVLNGILESVNDMPGAVRYICSLIEDLTARRFPNARLVGVGNLMFLRQLCPGIISAPSALNLRGRTLVAKVIQNIVNGVQFGGKEESLCSLNPLVAEFMPHVQSFLAKVCALASPTTPIITGVPEKPCITMASFRFHQLLVQRRDVIVAALGKHDRTGFVVGLNSLLPCTDQPMGHPLEANQLPEVFSKQDVFLPGTGFWFYQCGLYKGCEPAFCLVLSRLPSDQPTANLLASIFQIIRHGPSVPFHVVVDATFTPQGLTQQIIELITEILQASGPVLENLIVAHCPASLLPHLKSRNLFLVQTMSQIQELIPDADLPRFTTDLMTNRRSDLAVAITCPEGTLRIGQEHLHLISRSGLQEVHDFFHITEIAFLMNDQELDICVPKNNSIMVVKTQADAVHAELQKMHMELQFPAMETCSLGTIEREARIRALLSLVSVLRSEDASTASYRIADNVTPLQVDELCAHLVLCMSVQEKLGCLDALRELIAQTTDRASWAQLVARTLVLLSVADKMTAHVAERTVATFADPRAVKEALLTLLDSYAGTDLEYIVKQCTLDYVRHLTTVIANVHVRFLASLRESLAGNDARTRNILRNTRLLLASIWNKSPKWIASHPDLFWALHVASKCGLPGSVVREIEWFLWSDKAKSAPGGRFTGNAAMDAVAANGSTSPDLSAQVTRLCLDHMRTNCAATIPSLELLSDLCSAVTREIIDAALNVVACTNQGDPPVRAVDSLAALLKKPFDPVTVGPILRSLVLLGLVLIGLWGNNERLVQSAIQYLDVVLDRIAEHKEAVLGISGVLVPPPAALTAVLNKGFGVSCEANMSIAAGVMLRHVHDKAQVLGIVRRILQLSGIPVANATAATSSADVTDTPWLTVAKSKSTMRFDNLPVPRSTSKLSAGPAVVIPDNAAGLIFPVLVDEAACQQLFPTQSPTEILASLEMVANSQIMLLAYAMQDLDAANGRAHQEWVFLLIEAMHRQAPGIFPIFVDPIASTVERCLANNSSTEVLQRACAQLTKLAEDHTIVAKARALRAANNTLASTLAGMEFPALIPGKPAVVPTPEQAREILAGVVANLAATGGDLKSN
ncbi:hypothetical protein AMAG_01050 [Allomyces macrogynus ATCC 38327]|uniref:Ras-GAP domain-containing protein n=1 Tax=Allomyces macrogynus (strain ATCC 38327) TaxID=578462 RepID=A0A0L0RYF7_ALLM3|nr:hypothetical protein AMAG_01050 [Allomyces macrogynus ATCC 38327]|eukprot:KNE55119.1 hypothetical protein AMAG_01050 [Allomyces macrogynus ATCC 38327]